MPRKVYTTVYLTAQQDALLRALAAATKVPFAELVRQGVDLILEHRKAELPAPDGSPPPAA